MYFNNPSQKNRLFIFFIIALILIWVTAFAVETELRWLLSQPALMKEFAEQWLKHVYVAVVETNAKYPMLAHRFNWLALAHIEIAMAFILILGICIFTKNNFSLKIVFSAMNLFFFSLIDGMVQKYFQIRKQKCIII